MYFSYGADQHCSVIPRANLTQIKFDTIHVSILIDDLVVWCTTVTCCNDVAVPTAPVFYAPAIGLGAKANHRLDIQATPPISVLNFNAE